MYSQHLYSSLISLVIFNQCRQTTVLNGILLNLLELDFMPLWEYIDAKQAISRIVDKMQIQKEI